MALPTSNLKNLWENSSLLAPSPLRASYGGSVYIRESQVGYQAAIASKLSSYK